MEKTFIKYGRVARGKDTGGTLRHKLCVKGESIFTVKMDPFKFPGGGDAARVRNRKRTVEPGAVSLMHLPCAGFVGDGSVSGSDDQKQKRMYIFSVADQRVQARRFTDVLHVQIMFFCIERWCDKYLVGVVIFHSGILSRSNIMLF